MSFKVLQYFLNIIVLISFIFTFNACGAKPKTKSRDDSFAITAEKTPTIIKHFNNVDINLKTHTAFYSLANPTDALAARVFLVENAQTSLDVQYYIYEKDKTGTYFSKKLIQAADRGVRVRILLDDLSTTDKDRNWIELASHKNIELRLFNPNPFRTSLRNMALLFNVDRFGKRMHNKTLIADSSIAIIGGRNIGDIYFAADETILFIDYDAIVIGEVVSDIYNQFDIFWNTPLAVDYKKIMDRFIVKYKHITGHSFNDQSIETAILNSNFTKATDAGNLKMIKADNTDFYFDLPDKVTTPDDDLSNNISVQIYNYMCKAKNSLLIVSPYFVPSDSILKKLKKLKERGIKITIITNSLASVDFFGVYSGYQNKIAKILAMDIDLYEIKSTNVRKFLSSKSISNHSHTAIHTKMMIIDNTHILIGSANIDNRSDKLNTEITLVVNSNEIALKRTDHILSYLDKNYFYKLEMQELEPFDIDYGMPRTGITWHTIEDGEEKVYFTIPNAGFWRTFGANILSYIPIEGYL